MNITDDFIAKLKHHEGSKQAYRDVVHCGLSVLGG